MSKRKKIFCQKKYKGVTLLELLVVIAIISIVSTISFATLNGIRESSRMENACNEAAALINKTRDYALTGKKFEKDINGNIYDKIPKRFVVVFEKNKDIVYIQEPTDDGGAVFERIILPAKVSENITITLPGGGTRAWSAFSVPYGSGVNDRNFDEIIFKKGDETDSTQKVVIKGNDRFAVCE